VTSETTFADVCERFFEFSGLPCDVTLSVFVALSETEVRKVDNFNEKLHELSLGQIVVLEPKPAAELWALRPPAVWVDMNFSHDYFASRFSLCKCGVQYPDTLPEFLELRKQCMSICIRNAKGKQNLIVPESLSFGSFCKFAVEEVFQMQCCLDTVLFYRLGKSTRHINGKKDDEVRSVFRHQDEVEMVFIQHVSPVVFEKTVRLRITVRSRQNCDATLTSIFPGDLKINELLNRANERKWLFSDRVLTNYRAVQLGTRGRVKHVLDGEATLAEVKNPLRIEKIPVDQMMIPEDSLLVPVVVVDRGMRDSELCLFGKDDVLQSLSFGGRHFDFDEEEMMIEVKNNGEICGELNRNDVVYDLVVGTKKYLFVKRRNCNASG
jgi:hypothetical protein